jgi:hypothetical protein
MSIVPTAVVRLFIETEVNSGLSGPLYNRMVSLPSMRRGPSIISGAVALRPEMISSPLKVWHILSESASA